MYTTANETTKLTLYYGYIQLSVLIEPDVMFSRNTTSVNFITWY